MSLSKMPEQEINSAAAKFISSLVKSLQILCNGQVEFNECIELVGHINVKVDKIHKFDYIVDEQVSREGNDSSTTFLSNSYHSSPPGKPSPKASVPQPSDLADYFEHDIPEQRNTQEALYKANTDSRKNQARVMVKLEGDESDDCMVLPASPEDFEAVDDLKAHENLSIAGPSSAISDSYDTEYDSQAKQYSQTGKKRKFHDYDQEEMKESKVFRSSDYHKGLQASHSIAQPSHPLTHTDLKGGIPHCTQCKRQFPDDESVFTSSPCSSYESAFLHQVNLYCPTCGQKFYRQDELNVHRLTCYNQSFEGPPLLATSSEDACSCTMCGCILPNSQERLQHMNIEHGVTIYPCPSCDEVFGSSRLLCQHKKIKHGVVMPQLSCPMCKKTFTTALNLRGHMNMHQGLKPYVCRKCGDSFAYSQSKHRHQKICNGTPKPQSWIL